MDLARGHAEALLPLVERVIARVEGGFDSPTGSRSRSAGQLYRLRVGLSRPARWASPAASRSSASPRSRPCSRRCSPPTRIFSARATCSPPRRRPPRHVYFQALSQDGGIAVPPSLLPLAEALRLLARARRRSPAPPPRRSRPPAAPQGVRAVVPDGHIAPQIAWVASLGLVADPAHALAPPSLPARAGRPAAGPRAPRPPLTELSPMKWMPFRSPPHRPCRAADLGRPSGELAALHAPPSRGPGGGRVRAHAVRARPRRPRPDDGHAARRLRPVAPGPRRGRDPHRRPRPFLPRRRPEPAAAARAPRGPGGISACAGSISRSTTATCRRSPSTAASASPRPAGGRLLRRSDGSRANAIMMQVALG